MPYYIPRPQVTQTIEWTGSNLVEVEAWAAINATWAVGRLSVDGDVLTIDNSGISMSPGDNLTDSSYLPAVAMVTMQEVPGPVIYTTEEE